MTPTVLFGKTIRADTKCRKAVYTWTRATHSTWRFSTNVFLVLIFRSIQRTQVGDSCTSSSSWRCVFFSLFFRARRKLRKYWANLFVQFQHYRHRNSSSNFSIVFESAVGSVHTFHRIYHLIALIANYVLASTNFRLLKMFLSKFQVDLRPNHLNNKQNQFGYRTNVQKQIVCFHSVSKGIFNQ